jgi:predicted Na+-dependent transporter
VAFAASQKTLPVGLVLYDQYFREEYPFAVMPVLAYHVGQLLVDTVFAKQWACDSTWPSPPEPENRSDV